MCYIIVCDYVFTQKRNDYLSPPELVNMALRELKTDIFDCDVCCSQEHIPALNYYKQGETDGLTEYWYKVNWCNPPFDTCAKWIKKAYEEQQIGKTTVMLIPVRTETKYWHDYILFNPKVKIQWLRKGYCFINPDNNKKMGIFKNPLALVYFYA